MRGSGRLEMRIPAEMPLLHVLYTPFGLAHMSTRFWMKVLPPGFAYQVVTGYDPPAA